MKISKFRIKEFLENPNSLRGILIHGNDICIINFLVEELIAKLQEYSVCVMDFGIVNKLPDLLLYKLANIEMFSNKKLFKLVNVNRNISIELKNVLDGITNGHYIVMIANEPLCNSPTQNYVEISKIFGIITCYKSSRNSLCEKISSFLRKNNVKYTSEVIFYLENYFKYSELSIHLELERLVLYLGSKNNLELADLKSYILDFSNECFTLDSLYSAVANKDTISFIKISNYLILEKSFSPIALIRVMSNYFLRLEKVLLLIQSGINERAAINQLDPPLSFRQLQNFKLHLKKCNLPELKRILERLVGVEILCKETDLDHKMIFQHIILQMSSNLKS